MLHHTPAPRLSGRIAQHACSPASSALPLARNEGMSTTKHINVLLTIPEEKELALMDADRDDRIISAEEARAAVKSSAELSVSISQLWKIVFGVIALLFLAWLANAGLMVAVFNLSKDLDQTLKVKTEPNYSLNL